MFHGQTLNVSNISRDAGVARTTAQGYLEILEETLLCFSVPAFEAKIRVRERKLSKWYWCDPGIVRAIKGASGIPLPEEKGALFEGLAAQMIRAYRDYAGVCDEFFYWAIAGGSRTEVDFLLRWGNDFVAVETKSGAVFAESWCKGLRAISGLDGLLRRIVVYPSGPELQTRDGIDVIPFSKFSDLLANDGLWP